MKKAHIQTFGCQMNEHDSNKMATILEREGYEIIEDIKKAQLVLINTCSVRENPENKVYSLLGRLSRIKKKKPEMIIGVAGCVAQQEGKRILKRVKEVDLVFGTDNIFRLPQMLEEVESGKRVLYTGWMPREKKVQNFIPTEEIKAGTVEACKGLIAITKGCNNFCSYCIVPTTRGRLVSRQKDNIIEEAKDLISKGAKEIQLLGQNVNSYQADDSDFYDLLKSVADLEGLKRVRFVSPHPNDWNDRLTDLMADHPVICKHIHLPFQAGADRVLKEMRRGHTAEEYLAKVDYIKKRMPNIGITTDVIVGYPGETEEDFLETLRIIKEVRFNLIYAFKYSPRPGTRAAEQADDIAKAVKEERLKRLHDLQNAIQSEILESMVGSTQEVMIEGAHPKERGVMIGRNHASTPISVYNPTLDIGDFVEVKVTGRKRHSLISERNS